MAHDLRLRFNSPTVNLFFESCGDFIDYVADLRYYSQAELCECPYAYEGARRYPVGMLKGNGTLPDIKIHFLHYRSFEEAREKWLERSGRIDFDNLCVVMQAAELDEGLLERFERLPISRKVILGYETLPLQSPSIFKMRSLDSFVPGRILDYNGLSGRRYLDDFDYVALGHIHGPQKVGAKLPPPAEIPRLIPRYGFAGNSFGKEAVVMSFCLF